MVSTVRRTCLLASARSSTVLLCFSQRAIVRSYPIIRFVE
jgi:hypothetical protein